MEKINQEVIERFWSKVRKTRSCWIWIGGKHRQGYGVISVFGKDKLAHRISYLLHFKKLPKNKMVCHHCDNTFCVRPDHLFLGTQIDNMRDMKRKGRNANVSGERNPNRILNLKDVSKIRMLLKKKIPYIVLAKKFGVSYGTINNIVSGNAWKNL